jgi:hypothetical protein
LTATFESHILEMAKWVCNFGFVCKNFCFLGGFLFHKNQLIDIQLHDSKRLSVLRFVLVFDMSFGLHAVHTSEQSCETIHEIHSRSKLAGA